MTFVLVTPSTEFEAQVKRAFAGDFDGERRWEASTPRMDPKDAVRKLVPEPTRVVVLGPDLEVNHALALAGSLDLLRPEACVVLVAKPTPRLWERAMRAGARDVLDPASSDESVRECLTLAADAAARRVASVIATRDSAAKPARVIAMISSKGGSGKTTVSTNVAVGLAKLAPNRVVLVDLDLQFGDAPASMRLNPHATIAQLSQDGARIGPTVLKSLLEPHGSGCYVLCSPETPGEAEDVTVAAVGQALDILASEFDFVVVDTSAGLDEYALAAIDRATDLVLVGATDVPTVKGMRKVTQVLDVLGISARRHFLLNRSNARVGLGTREIEASVGMSVAVAVPSSRTIPVSLNQGSPVLESNPKSPAARALAELVTLLHAQPARSPAPSEDPRHSRRRRKVAI